MSKTKVGILGLGAIGSVIAGLLINQEHLELIGFNRSDCSKIGLQQPNGEKHFFINCYITPPNNIKLDWLIICLKEYHYATAKHWFSALISLHTKVVVIRNGIHLKTPLLPFCQKEQILETMIDCPTQKLANGQFKQFKNPIITCPKNELAIDFIALFDQKNISFQPEEDFKTANWKKLCESTSIGAITCLSGETCWIFRHENIQQLYTQILQECIAVGKADGAYIEANFMTKMLEKLTTYPADKGSSMLSDRLNGNPIELGAKSGAIVAIGKKHQIPTPLNELVCLLLKYTNTKKISPVRF